MRANDIKVGMTLELKKERAEIYDRANLLVKVTRIKERKGYSVPWIISDISEGIYEAFKPSDFARCTSDHTPTCIEVNENRARYECICK